MKETWDYEHCVSVLTGEVGLLKKISAAQDKVRQAVMNREWSDFEENTLEVNSLGSEFAYFEEERARLFSALANASHGGDDSSGGETSNASDGVGAPWTIQEKPFYASIMKLPTEERRELSRLYRELKMETLKMRAVNETFLAYLNEARSLATAYLEAVCPAEDGKLYTRKGCRAARNLQSIVFNNRF